jgi:hypothetical protein
LPAQDGGIPVANELASSRFLGPRKFRRMTNLTSRHRSRRPLRRGSLTVEMLLVVVVLLIVTIGIVQFGVFFANAQMVALAARVGGLEASQTPNLPMADGGVVPDDVLRAIEHQLASSCIDWCQVRLEHNVTPGGNAVALTTSLDEDCQCAPHGTLSSPPFPDTHYVRLTVCVPLSEVFPKQLSFFGTQLFGSERTYEHTATFRYELTAP